ncbi:flavanone 3-dioxygenase 2-like [Prunus avium]|uniref:Flavanone 3-dioxygenase 2-like n=1 Tax=Prunus avium TaxID=42229 RepID=A0A6P5SA70_PRUAV|nr:flavanone 3-dioxygenase 2-like [Prunus avium]
MSGTQATQLLLTQSPNPCFKSSKSVSSTNGSINCFSGRDHESCHVPSPIIDYSVLISNDCLKRSQAINDLNQACLNYGFFTVTNHGIPDSLIGSVMNWLSNFFNQSGEEKRRYDTNDPTDRIRFRWGGRTQRELLHMRAHPTFHCPTKPADSMVLTEYCERMREMGMQLLRGISKSLGLEECYIENKMKLELGYSVFGPNYYPALSQSSDDKNQIGQFPHRDPGLLVLLAQNVGGGLQIEHQKKWLNADFPPSSIFVIVADHIEILTNGKYKSLLHRVALNSEVERMSLPFFFGPSLDVTVKPEPEFVDDHNPPSYRQMTYKAYLESNDHHVIEARANLNQIRL